MSGVLGRWFGGVGSGVWGCLGVHVCGGAVCGFVRVLSVFVSGWGKISRAQKAPGGVGYRNLKSE